MRLFRPDPEEYQVAQKGTVFARLDRGIIRGNGTDRLDLLHRLSTGDIGGLKPGEEGTTVLTSDKGRVIEVARVLAFDDHVLMLLQGTDVEEVRTWLDKYTIMDDFTTEDASADYALTGVYGEHAKAVLESLLETEIPDQGTFLQTRALGTDVVVIRDIRLNGSGSFILIMPGNMASNLSEALAKEGATEISEETRQSLRIEVGQPDSGTELTQDYNPLEAGLVSWISFTKGCYIGQEVIARLDTYDKVKRRLTGLKVEGTLEEMHLSDSEELIVREPVEDVAIGVVTSLTDSPRVGGPVGLAYIRSAYASPDLPVVLVTTGDNSRIVAKGLLAKLPL